MFAFVDNLIIKQAAGILRSILCYYTLFVGVHTTQRLFIDLFITMDFIFILNVSVTLLLSTSFLLLLLRYPHNTLGVR